MNDTNQAKKYTLTYVVTYLWTGGIGLAFFPTVFLSLFMSSGGYGDIMPRLVGMFMLVLGFIVFMMLRRGDYQYYGVTVWARSFIVGFLCYLYIISHDPFFMIINTIVLTGLLPSVFIHLKSRRT